MNNVHVQEKLKLYLNLSINPWLPIYKYHIKKKYFFLPVLADFWGIWYNFGVPHLGKE